MIPRKSHRRADAMQLPIPSASTSTEPKAETKAEILTSSQHLTRSKAFSSAERLSATAMTCPAPPQPTATSASFAATQEEKGEILTQEERLSLSKEPISSEHLPERMAALKAKMERMIEQKNAPLTTIPEDSPFSSMCTCIISSVLHDCNHLTITYIQKCANWKEDTPCKATSRRRDVPSFENGACPNCKVEEAEKESHRKKMEDVRKKRAARDNMEVIERTATEQKSRDTASELTQENIPKAELQGEEARQHSDRDNSNLLKGEVQRESLKVASSQYESEATQQGLPSKLKNSEVSTSIQAEYSTERAQKLQVMAGKALMKGAIQEAFTNLRNERNWRSNYHFDMEAIAALSGLETAAREGNEEKVVLEKERFHEAVRSYKQSLEDVHKASEKLLLERGEETVQMFFETMLE